MQEGLQLLALLEKVKALRKAGLRAEHVAFSFMKRRIQLLMGRDRLGYEYTGEDDSSWMLREEIPDELIIETLGEIFKDMPLYTPCPMEEYSASRPPKKVSSRGRRSHEEQRLIKLHPSYNHKRHWSINFNLFIFCSLAIDEGVLHR
jgi:hypothetical protein